MNYYEILGVEKTCSQEDIKKAYKTKAFELHPDRNPNNPEAEKQFKEINEANQVLSSPEKREEYDQRLNGVAGNPFGFGGFGDENLSSFFNFFSHGNNHQNPFMEEEDVINGELNITLKDVLTGKTQDVAISFMSNCGGCKGAGNDPATASNIQDCSNCNGSGRLQVNKGFLVARIMCGRCQGRGKIGFVACKTCAGRKKVKKSSVITVNIPPGIKNRNAITINTAIDGEQLSLNIGVNILPHERFERDDAGNIKGIIELSYPEIVFGTSKEYQILDESFVKIKVPERASPGSIIKLAGKGLPRNINSKALGDLYLEVKLHMPKVFTEKQKEAIEALKNSFIQN